MRERHLRLVISNCSEFEKTGFLQKIFNELIENFGCIFVSNNEKIYMIKNALMEIYKDYELTTGFIDIPYFVKAEEKIYKIIKDKKINYYYLRLKKLKNKLN